MNGGEAPTAFEGTGEANATPRPSPDGNGPKVGAGIDWVVVGAANMASRKEIRRSGERREERGEVKDLSQESYGYGDEMKMRRMIKRKDGRNNGEQDRQQEDKSKGGGIKEEGELKR